MKTILVIDDERNIVDLLRLYLEKEGWAVLAAGNGEEGLELHRRHEPDLVILDLMLPRIDGFEVCRELRRRGDTPILMLTARDDDVDSIVGLELGADDYVTKPFNPRALVARVKATCGGPTSRPRRPADRGRLAADRSFAGAKPLPTPRRSYTASSPLAALPATPASSSPGRPAEGVWGPTSSGETRTVDVHVGEVRVAGGTAPRSRRSAGRLPAGAARPRAGPTPAPPPRADRLC